MPHTLNKTRHLPALQLRTGSQSGGRIETGRHFEDAAISMHNSGVNENTTVTHLDSTHELIRLEGNEIREFTLTKVRGARLITDFRR
jgi:hypothetical protein